MLPPGQQRTHARTDKQPKNIMPPAPSTDRQKHSKDTLITNADDKLFNLTLYSKHHVLHSILLDHSDFNYNLRERRHNLVLTAESSSIT